MTRLVSTLRWDFLMQFRQGILYAAIWVMAVWAILLWQIPAVGLQPILVSILFLDLSIFGFFFMAGLFYLEKADRVLEGLVVSPMQNWEYLTSKVITLTLLTVAVAVMVVAVTYDLLAVNWLWLILGVALMAAPITLFGFVLAARYDGMNEYLPPALFFLLIMQLPLIHYFQIWPSWLFYLVPSQPGMILLQAAFDAVDTWELLYAVLYALVLTGLAMVWALRTFERAVVRRAGG